MQQHINKSAMMNGLVIGALISLKFLLATTNSSFLSTFAFMISMFIIVMLYRFAKNFRDKEGDGYISYRHAFNYLFLLYLYGTIISSLVTLIFTSFIEKDFLSALLSSTMTLYDKMHWHIDDNTYSLMETIYTPAPYALFNVFGGAIIATFWGLILAAFIKKDKNVFNNNDNLA